MTFETGRKHMCSFCKPFQPLMTGQVGKSRDRLRLDAYRRINPHSCLLILPKRERKIRYLQERLRVVKVFLCLPLWVVGG